MRGAESSQEPRPRQRKDVLPGARPRRPGGGGRQASAGREGSPASRLVSSREARPWAAPACARGPLLRHGDHLAGAVSAGGARGLGGGAALGRPLRVHQQLLGQVHVAGLGRPLLQAQQPPQGASTAAVQPLLERDRGWEADLWGLPQGAEGRLPNAAPPSPGCPNSAADQLSAVPCLHGGRGRDAVTKPKCQPSKLTAQHQGPLARSPRSLFPPPGASVRGGGVCSEPQTLLPCPPQPIRPPAL